MSPLAAPQRDLSLGRMLALSGALHALVFVVGAAWLMVAPPASRLSPVAVVDLISGSSFPPSAEREVQGPPAAARRTGPARGSPAPKPVPKKEKAAAAKGSSAPAPAPRAAAQEVSPHDARAFSEQIGRLRKEKEARAAVDAIKRERAVRAAVRNIGEHVAHRVDLSPLRTPVAGAGLPSRSAALAGGAGNTRVSPELMAYARSLDERIRASWTVPEPALKEAGRLIVQVRITIEKDGRVGSVRMEKDSGNTYFDDSVLRAIRKASPLPVPPEQLRGGEDHYEVGFRFHGAGGGS